MNNFYREYHDFEVKKYAIKLEEKGYKVSFEKKIAQNFMCDLFAEKENEKIIYEFKITGNSSNRKNKHIINQINMLKNIATQNNYKLKVIYLTLPIKKEISIEWLELLLFEYFSNNTISEVDILSIHTHFKDISIGEINDMELKNEVILIRNLETSVTYDLDYGSSRESNQDENENIEIVFPCKIDKICISYEKEIESLEYDIDTDSFYE